MHISAVRHFQYATKRSKEQSTFARLQLPLGEVSPLLAMEGFLSRPDLTFLDLSGFFAPELGLRPLPYHHPAVRARGARERRLLELWDFVARTFEGVAS